MEFVLSLIKTISAVSVITAIFWLIMPKGTMEGSFRYAMGIFVLSAIVSLFIAAPFEYDIELNTEKAESAVQTAANNINYTTSEFLIEQLLQSAGINFKQIKIITDKSSDGNINITKAIIYLENENQLPQAIELIKNQTGITAVGG